jgi:hypothetical protein
MSWFKTMLLLGVLGMTWVDCGRRPGERSDLAPEAVQESLPMASGEAPASKAQEPGAGFKPGAS